MTRFLLVLSYHRNYIWLVLLGRLATWADWQDWLWFGMGKDELLII